MFNREQCHLRLDNMLFCRCRDIFHFLSRTKRFYLFIHILFYKKKDCILFQMSFLTSIISCVSSFCSILCRIEFVIWKNHYIFFHFIFCDNSCRKWFSAMIYSLFIKTDNMIYRIF